jgi:hypothetical protein
LPDFYPAVYAFRQEGNYFLHETFWAEQAYSVGRHNAGLMFLNEAPMKILVAAAMLSAIAVSPASAAMMKCTSDNMAKSTTMMSTMADGPGKMAANKEIGMANTAMSQGKMGMACSHYMKAQKAAMMK